MTDAKSDSWSIICTKPKQEFIAEKNLRTLGVDVYLPIYNKKLKKNKNKVEVVAPLFSGYLFAKFEIKDFYHKVRYTKGVKNVLGNSTYLWSIDSQKIMDIKSREEDGVVVLIKSEAEFEKGDKIIIDDGVFSGWEGIFYEELPDKERAIIMLTNVSYTSRLIVPKNVLILNK